MNRRWIFLVCSTLTLLAVVAGTGAFSATAADRGMQISVADDEDAYLGFNQTAETANGTTNLSVTIANQFPAGTTLTSVEVTVDGETRDVGPLDAGESRTVTFEPVDCSGQVAVDASGGTVSVGFDREECG